MDHADRAGGGVAQGGVWTVLQDGRRVVAIVRRGDDNLR